VNHFISLIEIGVEARNRCWYLKVKSATIASSWNGNHQVSTREETSEHVQFGGRVPETVVTTTMSLSTSVYDLGIMARMEIEHCGTPIRTSLFRTSKPNLKRGSTVVKLGYDAFLPSGTTW
jgi:hypothetical protein